ncbi:MAG: hypothetical protein ACE5OQ_14685 [Woeseia sp.]
MSWVYWLLVTGGLTFAVLYFLFPASLVRSIIGAARCWARMSQKHVGVDGITWPYLEGGPADAETIVMVHGFGGDKAIQPSHQGILKRGRNR